MSIRGNGLQSGVEESAQDTRKRVRPDTVCPHYHRAVELIGGRWTGAVISAMLDGSSRFSDLKGAIPDISDRMLSERLKELEAEGIVERHVIPETPVRVEYEITEKGLDLESVVVAIQAWASEWIAESSSNC